jgi:hypothetical protein
MDFRPFLRYTKPKKYKVLKHTVDLGRRVLRSFICMVSELKLSNFEKYAVL